MELWPLREPEMRQTERGRPAIRHTEMQQTEMWRPEMQPPGAWLLESGGGW